MADELKQSDQAALARTAIREELDRERMYLNFVQEQIKKDRDSFEFLFKRTTWLISAFLVVVVAVAAYLLNKSFSDLRGDLKQIANDEIAKSKAELEKRIPAVYKDDSIKNAVTDFLNKKAEETYNSRVAPELQKSAVDARARIAQAERGVTTGLALQRVDLLVSRVESLDSLDDYGELVKLSRAGPPEVQTAAKQAMRRLIDRQWSSWCGEQDFTGPESNLVAAYVGNRYELDECVELKAAVKIKSAGLAAEIVSQFLESPQFYRAKFSFSAPRVNAVNLILGTSFEPSDSDSISGWWRQHQIEFVPKLIDLLAGETRSHDNYKVFRWLNGLRSRSSLDEKSREFASKQVASIVGELDQAYQQTLPAAVAPQRSNCYNLKASDIKALDPPTIDWQLGTCVNEQYSLTALSEVYAIVRAANSHWGTALRIGDDLHGPPSTIP